jgi:hypothetical protein
MGTIESVIHTETSQEVSRYCLRCHHNLRGLCGDSLRCPECGRAFDAADPKRYSNHPFGENWAALAQRSLSGRCHRQQRGGCRRPPAGAQQLDMSQEIITKLAFFAIDEGNGS